MSLMDHVDASTQLAKNNEVQLLVFKASEGEHTPFYAINVFKTREVVEAKNHFLTEIPSSHRLLEGTIVLRGLQIPILNLPLWLNNPIAYKENDTSRLLICDFNGVIIGLRITEAHRVIKKNWSDMHAPDSYNMSDEAKVVNDTRLEDGSICMVLDFEQLLADVIPSAMVNVNESPENIKDIDFPEKLQNGILLIAEDSKVAQRHLKQILTKAEVAHKVFNNGKLLIDYINDLPDKSIIPAIITDIEMPEMSGFTVLRLLRENPQTADIPIIVNSSMTGENNKREAENLGADGFVNKTKSHDILPLVIKLMNERGLY
ncbi:chemotaxis protein CheV [Sulfurimonas sp. MAG313]|nr:chemotaxis protein [Sulfurimonas sp. MAG313]MDF1879762.1 chemotaxis protein CheV [Sulfurimonas sp. MAG313]